MIIVSSSALLGIRVKEMPAQNQASVLVTAHAGLRWGETTGLTRRAGCHVREVSEWAGHNSVTFTPTRYGGFFEDGSGAAVDRLDGLLSGDSRRSENMLRLSGSES